MCYFFTKNITIYNTEKEARESVKGDPHFEIKYGDAAYFMDGVIEAHRDSCGNYYPDEPNVVGYIPEEGVKGYIDGYNSYRNR